MEIPHLLCLTFFDRNFAPFLSLSFLSSFQVMEFMTRKAIRKMSSKEAGKKRVREGDSSASTPPPKVPAIDTSVAVVSSAVPDITVSAGGIVAEAIPPAMAPAAAPVVEIIGGEPVKLSESTSVKHQVDTTLDLELSLRQKRIHDYDIEGTSKANENVRNQTEVSKKIDMMNQGEDDGQFELVARARRINPQVVGDNVSSSGTFEGLRSHSNSGTLHGESGAHIDTDNRVYQTDIVEKIAPANQRGTLFESATAHGLKINMENLEHDVEQKTDDARPVDLTQLPPEGTNEQTAMEPGGPSTLDHRLNLMRLAERMLAAIDEQSKIIAEQSKTLEDQKKDMQRLLANQMMVGAATEMTQGAIYELRSLMSRHPNRGTLNWAYCGLMVVARLGYLTPHILEDPVIQILLGDQVEELRHVINSVLPYHHSIFPGSQ